LSEGDNMKIYNKNGGNPYEELEVKRASKWKINA
jgi:hypothetical protein